MDAISTAASGATNSTGRCAYGFRMTPQNWIALVAVMVAPLSALAGAWVNATLAKRGKAEEADAAARRDALIGLGRMKALLIDSQPSLVLANDLREYANPNEAVDGLFRRWLEAREALILLSVTHPNMQVRELAFRVQADVEFVLRTLDKIIKRGETADADGTAEHAFLQASESTVRLGELLSPYTDPQGQK